MSVQEEEPLIVALQVAKLIGVPLNTIHQLVHARRIPHVRFGRRFVRFRVAEIHEWIERHRVAPGGRP